jgi:hypothetical protein
MVLLGLLASEEEEEEELFFVSRERGSMIPKAL